MKARSLFYFFAVVCILFSGCKKEGISPTSIVGTWYVERYTVNRVDGSTLSNNNAKDPIANYENVGIFKFYQNCTGIYTYGNQAIPFTFIISDNNGVNNNSSSFNGLSVGTKTVNDNFIELDFDKSKIVSLDSPIITAFYQNDEKRFEVFSRTTETLLLSTLSKQHEFLITKQ
jgi:hypothetical protein